MPRSIRELPEKVLKALSGVDLIVHAGDMVVKNVLDELKGLKETKAVQGNMDSFEIRELLPETEVLSIGGRKIGLVHGSGSPYGIEQQVRERFDDVDVIIYGHSHIVQNKVIDGVLFFNPGPGKYSFGILTIDDKIRGEIVEV